MTRTSRFIIAAALVLLLAPMHAIAAVTPVGVITGPEDQWQGFADETWIAWTSNSLDHPNHFDAFVGLRSGGTAKKVNAAGSEGFAGNFDPGTDHLIYEQGTRSDVGIYFYDVSERTRWKVPRVNSKATEWQPKVSSAFILFQRNRWANGKWYTDVLLFDRTTKRTRRLGTWPNSYVIRTGNVGERYATFMVAGKKGWFGYVYDAQTKTRTAIPETQAGVWAPVVDELNSTVYFAASGNACGANVNIWRLPIPFAGSPTKIVDLPPGVDIGYVSSLAPDPDGGLDLLFYRIVCSKRQGDIYMARQVDQVV